MKMFNSTPFLYVVMSNAYFKLIFSLFDMHYLIYVSLKDVKIHPQSKPALRMSFIK